MICPDAHYGESHMSDITIYTTEVCPKCKILKEFFRQNGIEFREADMGSPASLTELAMNNVFTNMAPVLQIGDVFLTHKDLFSGMTLNEDAVRSCL